MDGMEAVRRIRQKDENVIVIFVTNMAQYAVKGYEVNALDFIIKPVRYDSFVMKMDRAISKCKTTQSNEIWITERNNKRRLTSYPDIKYVGSRAPLLYLSYDRRRLHYVRSII